MLFGKICCRLQLCRNCNCSNVDDSLRANNSHFLVFLRLFKFRAVATFLYTTRASDWLFGG